MNVLRRACIVTIAKKVASSLKNGQSVLLPSLLIVVLMGLFFASYEWSIAQEEPDIGALFQERCANCHGAAGQGNGELAGQLPQLPTDFTDPTFINDAVPAELFALITNGRSQNGMPPFGEGSSNPLTELERWQLVAYINELATPADLKQRGASAYQAHCSDCHGAAGLGNGRQAPQLATPPANLAELRVWVGQSHTALLTNLSIDQTISDHDFDLSGSELQDALRYARTLGFASLNSAALFANVNSRVQGTVMNASTGQTIVEPIEVVLNAFDGSYTRTETYTTTLQADGRFEFELNDAPADWVYMVSTRYLDLDYSSDIGRVTLADTAVALPITVYEKSSNPDDITISQLHITLAFIGDQLQVSELYTFDNHSNQVYVGQPLSPQNSTLSFDLPDGVSAPTFQRGFGRVGSFIPANEIIFHDNIWSDTLPLRPGPTALNMMVSYAVPYQSSYRLTHDLLYATNQITLIMPDRNVTFKSEGWQQQATQMDTTGETILSYTRSGGAAGLPVEIEISGVPTAAGAISTNKTTNWMMVVLGSLVALGIGTKFWLNARHAQMDESTQSFKAPSDGMPDPLDEPLAPDAPLPHLEKDKKQLLGDLVNLDIAYENGEISEAAYQKKRRDTKAQLEAIWN